MVENILLAILFGGVFTFVLGGTGLFLLNRYRAAQREVLVSADWPSTQGRITFSAVSDIVPGHSINDNLDDSHRAVVEYTYTVNGIEYTGNRIAFTAGGTFSGTRRDADTMAQHYHKNAPVTVFYDPRNPSEAVLEKAVGSKSGFLVLITLLILLGVTSCGLSLYAILRQFIG